MPCRFASSGTVATSRSASRAILALNAASNFLPDLVISVLHRLRQSRTLHTLTFGPISGVHFKELTIYAQTNPNADIQPTRDEAGNITGLTVSASGSRAAMASARATLTLTPTPDAAKE